MFDFLSAPVDTLIYSPTIFAPPLVRSLRHNKIGDKGASALAAVLKETRITHLECAAAPECLRLCQRPLTLVMSHRPCPPLACRLSDNNLTNYGRDMSGLLKLVEILPQTKIESLECGPAPSVCFHVSAR